MAKQIYSSKVVELGGQVPDFLAAAKMIIMFEESLALPELREACVMHTGNSLTGMIEEGDIYKISGSEFKILKVGSEVQKNLMNLGHITIKFDGGEGELLEGSIHVEDKPVPDIKPGDMIEIYKSEAQIVADGSWLGLKGKTAVVTGAASGIGKAVAQAFLDNGANVVVCDLNPNEPSFNLTENSGKVKYVVTNVAEAQSVSEMVKIAVDTFGKIDILVNNAGINIPCLLVDPKNPCGKYELNEKIYDKVTGVNLKGVYLVAQAVGHEMIKNGGVIINMSSESGLEGSEGQSIYAATKNAVNSFTRSWAKELGKYKIRVLGVAPGIMEATGLRTPAYEEALAYTRGISVEDLRKGYTSTKTTPLGRSGKLSEVADTVVFLASDRASYIHGVTYNVAGGKTRG